MIQSSSRPLIGFSLIMDRKFEEFSDVVDDTEVPEPPSESPSGKDPKGKSPTKSHKGDIIQYAVADSFREDKIIMLMKINRTFGNTTSLSENGSKIVAKDSKEIVSCHKIKDDNTTEESPAITVFRQQIEKVVSSGDQSLIESLKIRKENVTTALTLRPSYSETESTTPEERSDIPRSQIAEKSEISNITFDGETKQHEEEIDEAVPTSEVVYIELLESVDLIKDDTTEVLDEEAVEPDIQFEETVEDDGEIQFVHVETPEVTDLPQTIEKLESVLSTGERDMTEMEADPHILHLRELEVEPVEIEPVEIEPTEVEEFFKVQVTEAIVEINSNILPEQNYQTAESDFEVLDLSIEGGEIEELVNTESQVIANPKLQVDAVKSFPSGVEEIVRIQATEVIVDVTHKNLSGQSSPKFEQKQSLLEDSVGGYETTKDVKQDTTELQEFVKFQSTDVIVDVTHGNPTEQMSPDQSKVDKIIKKLGFEKATRQNSIVEVHKSVAHSRAELEPSMQPA